MQGLWYFTWLFFVIRPFSGVILWPWPWSLPYFLKTLTLLITFEQWVLKLWFFTRVFLVMRPFYGVPLGPLAISSLAFLFKNKNERFSHGNSKCLWNLDLLKNLRLKIARVRGQRSEISPSLSHSRSLSLAFSSLAFFKTSKFQTRLRFSCENLAFLFLNKKERLEIASGPNGTPYLSMGTKIFYPVTLISKFSLFFENFNLAYNFQQWVPEFPYFTWIFRMIRSFCWY